MTNYSLASPSRQYPSSASLVGVPPSPAGRGVFSPPSSPLVAANTGGDCLPIPPLLAAAVGGAPLFKTTGNKSASPALSVADWKERKAAELRSARRDNSLKLQRALRLAGRDLDANDVRQCGRLRGYSHAACGSTFYRGDGTSCQNPLCAYCQHERAGKIAAAWSPILMRFAAPAHLMLSSRRYPGESLDDAGKRVISAFRRMTSRKEFRAHVRGWVASCEVARSAGWGVHFHVLIDCDWWDVADISRLWHEVTGDSMVVWIKRVAAGDTVGLRDAISEVIKYPCKAADILDDPEAVVEYIDWVAGRRMFSAGGSCHGALSRYRSELAAAAGLTVAELDAKDAKELSEQVAVVKALEDVCPVCGGQGGIVVVLGLVRPRWDCVPINELWWGPAPPGYV